MTPAQTSIPETTDSAAPFTARIFTTSEFIAPNITLPAYANVAPLDFAAIDPDARELEPREIGAPFGFAWGASESSIAEQVAQDIEKVIEVRPGDTLYGVLVDAGVTEDEAKNAVGAISDVFSPRDLRAGQEITLNISTASGTRSSDVDPQLMSLTFEPDVVTDVTLTRSGSGDFVAAAIDKELVDANRRVAGVIDSSLFGAAQEAGVPMPVIADLIKTFSFDVDFQRDIQDGDSFELFYERKETAEGDFVKSGSILFASLTLSGKTIPVYYFERDGEAEYFTPKGETIRKSLLRTPIDGARITSGFGMRMHPLLGYSKMHKGVDFGAPTGTPIFAAGSGTVVEMGKKGAYGNYVRIRHNGEYQTAYAHMSKFAKGVKKGDRVKQGDVIGYVGATGRVTGPHLHYEVLIGGAQANPGKVKMASGDKLAGKQLKAFQAQMTAIDAERQRQADQQLIAETPGDAELSCGIDEGCQN
jgi:murein DD-endopeptidase MepM/ murein hydrolase activator NlpD